MTLTSFYSLFTSCWSNMSLQRNYCPLYRHSFPNSTTWWEIDTRDESWELIFRSALRDTFQICWLSICSNSSLGRHRPPCIIAYRPSVYASCTTFPCNCLRIADICLRWSRRQIETFSTLLAICAGSHRSPVNSPNKGQCRGASMFSLICAWTNGWINNRDATDLRRYRAHDAVTVMCI